MIHWKIKSQGIKSEGKRTCNREQWETNTWWYVTNLLHGPEKTQPVAWPCELFVDRLCGKPHRNSLSKQGQRKNLPVSSLPSPVSHWPKSTPLVVNFPSFQAVIWPLWQLLGKHMPRSAAHGMCAGLSYRQLGYAGNYGSQNHLSYVFTGLYLSDGKTEVAWDLGGKNEAIVITLWKWQKTNTWMMEGSCSLTLPCCVLPCRVTVSLVGLTDSLQKLTKAHNLPQTCIPALPVAPLQPSFQISWQVQTPLPVSGLVSDPSKIPFQTLIPHLLPQMGRRSNSCNKFLMQCDHYGSASLIEPCLLGA